MREPVMTISPGPLADVAGTAGAASPVITSGGGTVLCAAAPVATVASDLPKALPSPEVLYCARQGLTPLRRLRDDLRAIRAAGGLVRGIILWDAPRPILPALREAAGRTARRQSVEHENDRFAVAAK